MFLAWPSRLDLQSPLRFLYRQVYLLSARGLHLCLQLGAGKRIKKRGGGGGIGESQVRAQGSRSIAKLIYFVLFYTPGRTVKPVRSAVGTGPWPTPMVGNL